MTTNMAVVPDSGSSAEVADTHRATEPAVLAGLQMWVLEMTNKHGNPNGTLYEQGVNDHGFRVLGRIRELMIAAHQAPVSPAEQVETDWIEWAGGENPVPGQRVDVRFRDGDVSEDEPSRDWEWGELSSDDSIIAYRVLPTPPADRGIG
jgi:hypothetical protein